MKVFKNVEELANAPKELLDEHNQIVFEDDLNGDFMTIFGGNWHLIEDVGDLSSVIEGPYDIVEWKCIYVAWVLFLEGIS